MKIELINIDEIIPYENNAKLHPQEQIDQIKQSILEFGNNDPIAIDKNNVIIEGHGRLLALKELGYKEVEVIKLEHLTEEQRKAYTLIHNKLTMNTDFDMDLLMEELQNIQNIDMGDFDFDIQIEELESQEIEEDEYEVELPKEPKAKLGDIYQLGNHRLMCGSSTNVNDIEVLMNGKKPTLIYTDPPYGMNAVSKSGVLSKKYDGDIMNDDDNTTAIDSFNLVMNIFDKTKAIWWGANYYTECLPSSECWIVWDKNNGTSDQTDCELAWANFRSVVRQFTMSSERINRVHPTQKPVKLFQDIIIKFDKNNEFNDVLDLFGGSGSTLIACEQLNRNCYMMELDPKYVDVIIDRWETYTGQKAVLL